MYVSNPTIRKDEKMNNIKLVNILILAFLDLFFDMYDMIISRRRKLGPNTDRSSRYLIQRFWIFFSIIVHGIGSTINYWLVKMNLRFPPPHLPINCSLTKINSLNNILFWICILIHVASPAVENHWVNDQNTE